MLQKKIKNILDVYDFEMSQAVQNSVSRFKKFIHGKKQTEYNLSKDLTFLEECDKAKENMIQNLIKLFENISKLKGENHE